MGVFEI
jgi:hypothetical protein